MDLKKLYREKNIWLIALKLGYDALFLTLLTYAGMLVAEAVLPGFLSSRISFSKLTIFLLLLIGAIGFLNSKLGYTYKTIPKHKNRLLPFLIVFSFILIGNSMLEFSLWQNMIITLSVMSLFFIFYQLIFHHKEN